MRARAGGGSATIDGKSLVEFTPETGRTHQIRVHAARGLGCAIVGDPVYSDRDSDPEQPMLLHAWKLKVPRDAQAGDRRHRADPRQLRPVPGLPGRVKP